jgi:transposase
MVLPTGVAQLRQAVVDQLEAAKDKRTPLSQERLWQLVEELAALEAQLAYEQEHLDTLAQTHPACRRLRTMPGMGPFTATALVATAVKVPPGEVWCHATMLLEGRSAYWV